MVLNKLSKRPCSFSIYCLTWNVHIDWVFRDLDSNVSSTSYSDSIRFYLSQLSLTTISAQLADRFMKYQLDILEDVLIAMSDFLSSHGLYDIGYG